MSQISLFKSPENKRRKQKKMFIFVYNLTYKKYNFDIQKKNISLIIVATCRQVFALNDSWTGIQSSSLLVTYFAYVGFIVASS